MTQKQPVPLGHQAELPLCETASCGAASQGIGRRSITLLLFLGAFVLGACAGLHWPSLYGISHLLLDYHFGFAKRGLLGAALERLIAPPFHYILLVEIGVTAFATWVAIMAYLAWRPSLRDCGVAAASLLLLLSAGFACLVSDIGYLEHFELVLTLACLVLPVRWELVLARALVLILAAAIHEGAVLMFGLVVIFDVWLGAGGGTRPKALGMVALVLVPTLLATAYFGIAHANCQLPQSYDHFQLKAADFPIHRMAVDTLCGDTSGFRFALLSWQARAQFGYFALALIVILPSTLATLWMAGKTLEWAKPSLTIATVTTFAPLSLVLLAVDLVRFVTLAQVNALLVLLVSVRRMGLPEGGTLPAFLRRPVIMAGLILFQMGSSLNLTNGEPMQKFPFIPIFAHLMAVVQGAEPFVRIPSY